MTHGSLFSGIGGFDLAASWMGWDNVFHCEVNPFARQVLSYHFPESISYHDITKTDFSIHRGKIDIITGGFPCQPFSTAGKRKGTKDDRYLWPEMLRVIYEVKPSYVIGENVLGITSMAFEPSVVKMESEKNVEGETIHRTMEAESVIMRICEDIESIGYNCQPLIIPAAAVNAPHRRDRVWFIATHANESDKGHSNGGAGSQAQKELRRKDESYVPPSFCSNGTVANSECGERSFRVHSPRVRRKREQIEVNGWNEFPTQPPVCIGDDGLSTQLDGISFSKWRRESLKAYGNAIVPQVAFELFKGIEAHSA